MLIAIPIEIGKMALLSKNIACDGDKVTTKAISYSLRLVQSVMFFQRMLSTIGYTRSFETEVYMIEL